MNDATRRGTGEPHEEGRHPSPEAWSGFLEGSLSPSEEAQVREHLAECTACQQTLAAFQEIGQEAGALPDSLEPARDLWPEIETRVAAPSTGRRGRSSGKSAALPQDRRSRSLAIRASLLAAAVLVGVLAGHLLQQEEPVPHPGVASPEPEGAPAALVAQVEELEDAYEPTIRELEDLVGARELAPETRATLEDNLAVIEEAIAESREAVLADPEGARAMTNLQRMYETKVDVLWTMAHREETP